MQPFLGVSSLDFGPLLNRGGLFLFGSRLLAAGPFANKHNHTPAFKEKNFPAYAVSWRLVLWASGHAPDSAAAMSRTRRGGFFLTVTVADASNGLWQAISGLLLRAGRLDRP